MVLLVTRRTIAGGGQDDLSNRTTYGVRKTNLHAVVIARTDKKRLTRNPLYGTDCTVMGSAHKMQ